MALPMAYGEYGIVKEPDMRFSNSGKAWLMVRCVAKDRKQENGSWVDGDPTFIDIVVFGKQAENLYESAGKGDTILVSGKLVQKQWEDNEGNKRSSYQSTADQVGVSVRWAPAKTGQMTGASKTIESVKEALGAEELEEVPF